MGSSFCLIIVSSNTLYLNWDIEKMHLCLEMPLYSNTCTLKPILFIYFSFIMVLDDAMWMHVREGVKVGMQENKKIPQFMYLFSLFIHVL